MLITKVSRFNIELKDDGKTVNCYKPTCCEWCDEKIKSREQAIVRNYI